MTANWCPVAREERNQLCFGVWATLGSTGRWPEVVNMWELDGWDGLAANFEPRDRRRARPGPVARRVVGGRPRRCGAAASTASSCPSRGPGRSSSSCADGVRGEVYAHELVTRAGRDGAATSSTRCARGGGAGARGARPRASSAPSGWRWSNDSEAIVLWAIPDWATWAALRAGLVAATAPSSTAWRKTLLGLGADWRRTAARRRARSARCASVASRQVSDRRPLDEICDLFCALVLPRPLSVSATGRAAITDEGDRPAARAHRRARAAPACRRTTACRPTDTFRHVAEAYGDDNPLWCDPAYGADDALGRADRAAGRSSAATRSSARTRSPRSPPTQRDLMKGDPLRGVHAFYAAQRPRVVGAAAARRRRSRRRNALVGVLDKPSEFAERAVHEWTGAGVPRRRRPAAVGPVPADDPHRAREGAGAQEVRRRRARRRTPTSEIDEIEAQYAAGARPRRRAPLVGGRRGGRRGRPAGEGPAHRHRHDLLARRHGHGPLRREAAAARRRATAGASPASSTATSSTSPT